MTSTAAEMAIPFSSSAGDTPCTTRVILLSRSRPVYDSLSQVLANKPVSIRWETFPEQAVAVARSEAYPVVLVTAECDWRMLVAAVADAPNSPNVILLLQDFDPRVWADALQAGAFEVLPIEVRAERLTSAVVTAQRRWERRQLVRAALAQNPLVPPSTA